MQSNFYDPIGHRPIRVAQFLGPFLAIPPKKTGGTERIVYFLVEELVKRGYNVSLFAPFDSKTSAHLFSNSFFDAQLKAKAQSIKWEVYYLWMMAQIRRNLDNFDIVHIHSHELLGALHGQFGKTAFTDAPLVSISNDQRTHTPKYPHFVDTVYHGLPKNLYKFVPKPKAEKPYLAFLARLIEEKAPDWAIQIAVQSNTTLKIAAQISNQLYWQQTVEPMIRKHSDLVEFIGEVDDQGKQELLGNALAFIFPSSWAEPFGVVMIESMACGTPVIARNRGSVPEIIEPGVSGLLFQTIEEGVEAVNKIGQIDRAKVRKAFDQRFTVEAMVDGYERVYKNLMDEDRKKKAKFC
uniref:Glycosyltransferase n=1 Tax=Globodera rostochiensis TaxID=31243 RepID=A0A914IC08_GLORO